LIKKFEPQSLDDVMNIWLKTNISAHSFVEKTYWENAFYMVKSLLPTSDLYIYQEEGVIKGFIGITDGAYIAGLFVSDRYQGKGIGQKLLDYCKCLYPILELDVFDENKDATRFYQKNGFSTNETKINKDFNCEEHHMIWSNK